MKKTTQSATKSTSKKSVKKTPAKPSKSTTKVSAKSGAAKTASSKKPASNSLTKKRSTLIATIKERLIQERETLLHGLQKKEVPNEPSSHGDLVDQSTNFSEHEVMLGLAEHDRNRLQEINLALDKIDKGTYGICEMSGELISDERLEAMPTARYSVAVQAKLEGYG